VQDSTCLVDAYEDFNCLDEVSFLLCVEGFKIEQRAVIKFCVKLNGTKSSD
jgi:hypothetical protein